MESLEYRVNVVVDNSRVDHRDRIAVKVRELLAEGVLRVSLAGSRVGQVNGLAVTDLGDYRFGHPSRVTASAGVGQEGVINIERESDLSGSFHDKGVLILEGYLRNRYARQHPLALSASLAFEQSYAWIEGDSASLAELLALLSALASVPLRQDVAVTGSVNQHGEVQAVGAVMEKVEGFFDACRAPGLSGTQGVCVPRSNVANLILKLGSWTRSSRAGSSSGRSIRWTRRLNFSPGCRPGTWTARGRSTTGWTSPSARSCASSRSSWLPKRPRR